MSEFFKVHSYYLSDPNNEATGRRVNAYTGDPLTASFYTVDGILDEKGLRPLSIGQLVMAICLTRATQLENEIIEKMEAMAETTLQLETLTSIQETIVNNPDVKGNLTFDHTYNIDDWPYSWKGGTSLTNWSGLYPFLVATPEEGGAGCKGITDTSSPEEVVAAISSRLDALNTVSQKDMIKLQSLTSKRDQSYDLITNILKSCNTVLTSIARNTLR